MSGFLVIYDPTGSNPPVNDLVGKSFSKGAYELFSCKCVLKKSGFEPL